MYHPIADYPRPQLQRSSWENLNGPWNFAFDDDGRGLRENWESGFTPQYVIQVPFTYETKLSGIQDETEHKQVWYSRKIVASPHEGRVLLHFEGSDWLTDVYVNGRHAGTHRGGYARFSFDITDLLHGGENDLVVRVSDSLSRSQPRGKQRWRRESFACWYVPTTGIWKTVWLEYVPECRVDALKLTPRMESAEIHIEAQITGGLPGDLCWAEVSYEGIVVGCATAYVKEGLARLSVNVASQAVSVDDFLGWAPEHPHLYDLDIRLIRDNQILDQVASYFGMRDVSIRGNKLLLNDTVYYQRLVLDQGYWKDSGLTPPSEEAILEDIRKIKAMGFNGVRKHQKIEDERFLYWCDRLGLIVWSEFPATYVYTDDALEWMTGEWMEILRQNYSHSCITTWVPFNESWGIPNIRKDNMQQHFTQAIYYLTKAFDPMRPVICNDGWEHTVSDIVTLHDYVEQGAELYNHYIQNKDAFLKGDIPYMCGGGRYLFADGFRYRGQPVIFSEFGGIAMDNDANGWGYGTKVADTESFLQRFDGLVTAVKKLDYCCGFCYTQVTDVQQEQNGLMDMDRNFKVDPEILREIILRRI